MIQRNISAWLHIHYLVTIVGCTVAVGCSDAGDDGTVGPSQVGGASTQGSGGNTEVGNGGSSTTTKADTATGGTSPSTSSSSATGGQASGGTANTSRGGSSTTGKAEGGTKADGTNLGGSTNATGGAATGGRSTANGGASTGGRSMGAGGAATGGRSAATGGASNAAGRSSTGGKAAGGTATGGASAASGGTSGSSKVPTWAQLYTNYLAPGTIGHCGDCHSQVTSAATAYTFLRSNGQINGTSSPLTVQGSSRLVWFGGRMPEDGSASDASAQVLADFKAWVADGAKNN